MAVCLCGSSAAAWHELVKPVLYDHRTYTCRPGTFRKALEFMPSMGSPQTRHLGEPVLYAMTEVGDVNQDTSILGLRGRGRPGQRRAAMQADPEWQAYLKLSAEAGYLEKQENKLLLTAPFLSVAQRHVSAVV